MVTPTTFLLAMRSCRELNSCVERDGIVQPNGNAVVRTYAELLQLFYFSPYIPY